MDPLQSLLTDAVGLGNAYVSQGITVAVKTNYGPELQVYSGSMNGGASTGSAGPPSSPGILSTLLGLKAAVIVRDASGRILDTFGTPPPTDPVRVAILLGLLGLVLVLLARGVIK